MNDLIRKYNMPRPQINNSELVMRWRDNEMYFTSIDDPDKLKSIERINYVWSEESTELTKFDYMQLNLRCRGENQNGINQLYFSFNPSDESSFLKPLTETPPSNMAVLHTTYHDNRFLTPEYIEQLENLINEDETYYKIYALGEWATPEGIIYSKWSICKEWPESFDDTYYGLDFGFNNPSSLIELSTLDNEVYVNEKLYKSGLTNTDLIAKIQRMNLEDYIIADCAEPQRIKELNSNLPVAVVACRKGKDSIRRGIDLLKRFKLHIHPDSTNLLKEIRSYKWKTDKNGVILVPEQPVKFNDHAMDAMRYAAERLLENAGAGITGIENINEKEEVEDLENEEIWSEY